MPESVNPQPAGPHAEAAPRRRFYLWHHGRVRGSERRPMDALRETLLSRDSSGDNDYEVSEVSTSDTGGVRQINLQFTWSGPDGKYAVGAFLGMRHRAGSERVDWILAAANTRPWVLSMEPPAYRIGLTTVQAFDASGFAIPAHPPTLVLDQAEPAVVEEFAASLTSAERSANALLISASSGEQIPAWEGVLFTILVGEPFRHALNQALPTALRMPAGFRLYTAPCDQRPDVADPECVPGALAEAVMPLLHARRSTALPPAWSADPAVQAWWDLANPFTLAPPARTESDLTRELAEARQALSIAHTSLAAAKRQHETDTATIAELRARLEQQRGTDNAVLREQNTTQLTMLTELSKALEAAEADRDEQLRRNNALATALHAAGVAGPATIQPDEEFTDFPALLAAAATHLPDLTITAEQRHSSVLDHHPSAVTWRRKTWDALRTLNAYARARHERRSTGDPLPPELANAFTFVRAGKPGVLISASTVRMAESATVTNNSQWRQARTFSVPDWVDPTGSAYFGAHIVLERFKPPAPRLHFLDDLDNSGALCVGYVGPHLPNTKTN